MRSAIIIAIQLNRSLLPLDLSVQSGKEREDPVTGGASGWLSCYKNKYFSGEKAGAVQYHFSGWMTFRKRIPGLTDCVIVFVCF